MTSLIKDSLHNQAKTKHFILIGFESDSNLPRLNIQKEREFNGRTAGGKCESG